MAELRRTDELNNKKYQNYYYKEPDLIDSD